MPWVSAFCFQSLTARSPLVSVQTLHKWFVVCRHGRFLYPLECSAIPEHNGTALPQCGLKRSALAGRGSILSRPPHAPLEGTPPFIVYDLGPAIFSAKAQAGSLPTLKMKQQGISACEELIGGEMVHLGEVPPRPSVPRVSIERDHATVCDPLQAAMNITPKSVRV